MPRPRNREAATLTTSQLFKTLVRQALKILPDKGRSIRNLRWWLYLRFRAALHNFLAVTRKHPLPHPSRIYWVQPAMIQYVTAEAEEREHNNQITVQPPLFDNLNDQGKICGGDWDLSQVKFENLDIYNALTDRISGNRNWQDTQFYKRVLRQIRNGNYRFQCRSREDLDRRCHYIDELIKNINENGYELSRNVTMNGEEKILLQEQEEILCNIGRDGRLLFQDGRHRLAISKILGVERIPVKILVRHRKWVEFRELLLSVADKQNGFLYQPPLHLDLLDIPARHDCEDRFEVIKRHLHARSGNKGNMLDIGANLCFFCHRFEDLGYDCFAIEADPALVDLAARIRKAEGKNFEIIKTNFLNVRSHPAIAKKTFDVVLALNIFHHFLKAEKDYILLERSLNSLAGHIGVMFFEPHNPCEVQMQNAYRNYDEEEFVEFVKVNTGFSEAEHICETNDNRKLYKLYRRP